MLAPRAPPWHQGGQAVRRHQLSDAGPAEKAAEKHPSDARGHGGAPRGPGAVPQGRGVMISFFSGIGIGIIAMIKYRILESIPQGWEGT